jgi:hypothetical protein
MGPTPAAHRHRPVRMWDRIAGREREAFFPLHNHLSPSSTGGFPWVAKRVTSTLQYLSGGGRALTGPARTLQYYCLIPTQDPAAQQKKKEEKKRRKKKVRCARRSK